MRIGCVATTVAEAQAIASNGYNYIELKGDVLGGDNEAFRVTSYHLQGLSIPIEALTSPLPRSLGIKITGARANLSRAREAFDCICERASVLGVQIVSIGCGQARSVEPGFSREKAYEQLCEFLQEAATICAHYHIQAAVESLNREETNILNSIAETRTLVEQVNRPEIQLLADYYHICQEQLSLKEELEPGTSSIIHAHTADRERRYPGYASEDQAPFLQHLKKIGYNQRISVECQFVDFQQEITAALAHMRRACEAFLL